MTAAVEPWIKAGLERMERQAPNRYWKVMTAAEQRKRTARHQEEQAEAERQEIKCWKRKEEKRIKREANQKERAQREAEARRREAEREPDFVDQLFDIPNVIAGVIGVCLVWGFFSVMATTMGSAVVVWIVGFGAAASFLNGAANGR
jgi:ATP-dependent 26S proteasome regulatory subunit